MKTIVDIKFIEEYALLKAKKSAIVTQVQDTIYWNNRRKNKNRYDLLQQLNKEYELIEARIKSIEEESFQRRDTWKRN